ncbi:dioxygenase [Marinibacterium sp. SX1]|uniref:dioxygenase family protein n=1 Tax=Marinibacterium sp. SX1 TaxID=3388424 RepID=UPI003D17532B
MHDITDIPGRPVPGADGPARPAIPRDLPDRLAGVAPSRLTETVGALVGVLQELAADVRLTDAEFRATLAFLTEVGHHADPRRQEWVLLADALGLSARIEALNHPRPAGATPNTGAGPFYRPDAPDLDNGATISRDGKGQPLAVTGRLRGLDGRPVADALVEVWQANACGAYENQEPDHQPEHNLRGRFRSDGRGRFAFRSVMPGGYALPSDGPVGRLMGDLGLCLERPAHIHLRVTAPGYERLTTHVFDRDDPAIGRDAIFGVRPELLAEFRQLPAAPDAPETPGDPAPGRALDLDLVLCPRTAEAPAPDTPSSSQTEETE